MFKCPLMNPEKIHAILALPPPSNVREVRGVLGKTKYYQRFVDMFSEKMHPINSLRNGSAFRLK